MPRTLRTKPLDKLTRNTLPLNHQKEDFTCFGPIATEDGIFNNTMLCDLMCSDTSGDADKNKFFHASVVQSKLNNKWYLYTQWGRLGITSDFQFQELATKENACKLYCEKLHDKNDKRGEWKELAGRKTLISKAGKDLYLVRPQSVRKTGLPDAKNIGNIAAQYHVAETDQFDSESLKLLQDLNIGSAEYTRNSMADKSLPTKEAINEVSDLLDECTKILNCGLFSASQSLELEQLTRLIYSRIPKVRGRGHKIVFSHQLVQDWRQDLQAYEAALCSTSPANLNTSFNFGLKYLDKSSDKYAHIQIYFNKATANRHSYLNRSLVLKNVWEIDRSKDLFNREVDSIVKTDGVFPEFQPTSRLGELDNQTISRYIKSGTFILIHGTKSVNVGGILNLGLKLPKTLSNVKLTGQYYGNGIYMADDVKKSYGYTSGRNAIWTGGSGAINNRNSFMFLSDVICGDFDIVKGNTNTNNPSPGKHTIFAKAGYSDKGGSKLENNEFVIFNTDRINLRYLLEVE